MNPLPFILLAISLPLLLGGCGEKEESVAEVGPVEEKQEVKEEVKPEEPIAETKPKLEGVNVDELELRGDINYLKGSDAPYTGKSYGVHPNGQKEFEMNHKDGKLDGIWVEWRENGQKWREVNYKGGKEDGLQLGWYKNGQKEAETNYKDGKPDGLWVSWHENGEKRGEGNIKDGKQISKKWWNNKGEPVDTWREAVAE